MTHLAPAVASRTDLVNPRRVVRALERALVQGDRLPPAPRGYAARQVWIGLQVEPTIHATWMADRARTQFEGGLLEEARSLEERYDRNLRAFSAFGYREAFSVLDGSLTREQAIDRTFTRTRQFARRQRTWFRAEPDIDWLHATHDLLPDALLLVERVVHR